MPWPLGHPLCSAVGWLRRGNNGLMGASKAAAVRKHLRGVGPQASGQGSWALPASDQPKGAHVALQSQRAAHPSQGRWAVQREAETDGIREANSDSGQGTLERLGDPYQGTRPAQLPGDLRPLHGPLPTACPTEAQCTAHVLGLQGSHRPQCDPKLVCPDPVYSGTNVPERGTPFLVFAAVSKTHKKFTNCGQGLLPHSTHRGLRGYPGPQPQDKDLT